MNETQATAEYRQHLIAWAKAEAASERHDLPGFPLTDLPRLAVSDLDAVIASGDLRIVTVARPNPVGTGTFRHKYVAPARARRRKGSARHERMRDMLGRSVVPSDALGGIRR